ncbi:MAG: Clp protease N-terminal domain-containing protein [Acidimicrobiia bacterium]
MALTVTLDGLIQSVVHDAASDDLLDQLATASATAGDLGDLGDALLGHFVDRCRRDGHSWAEIGGSLGVTKQAVQKRFVARAAVPFMIERFTVRARRVLDDATEEARALGHNYRGTEHLLLALFHDPEGLAAKVLESMHITRAAVEREVLAHVTRGGGVPAADVPPLTPRAARVLELAGEYEALDLGHNYIGTEHILLGLLREGNGLAARVLTDLAVDHASLKAKTIELLSGYGASSTTP